MAEDKYKCELGDHEEFQCDYAEYIKDTNTLTVTNGNCKIIVDMTGSNKLLINIGDGITLSELEIMNLGGVLQLTGGYETVTVSTEKRLEISGTPNIGSFNISKYSFLIIKDEGINVNDISYVGEVDGLYMTSNFNFGQKDGYHECNGMYRYYKNGQPSCDCTMMMDGTFVEKDCNLLSDEDATNFTGVYSCGMSINKNFGTVKVSGENSEQCVLTIGTKLNKIVLNGGDFEFTSSDENNIEINEIESTQESTAEIKNGFTFSNVLGKIKLETKAEGTIGRFVCSDIYSCIVVHKKITVKDMEMTGLFTPFRFEGGELELIKFKFSPSQEYSGSYLVVDGVNNTVIFGDDMKNSLTCNNKMLFVGSGVSRCSMYHSDHEYCSCSSDDNKCENEM